MKRGYKAIKDCPICHKPNSNASFACCEEHEKEYLEICSKNAFLEKSELIKASWQNEEIKKARIEGQKQNKSLQEWLKAPKALITKDGVDTQILRTKLEDYLKDGWKVGRSNVPKPFISDKARKQRAQALSDMQSKMITVYDTNGRNVRILEENLQSYLDKGYTQKIKEFASKENPIITEEEFEKAKKFITSKGFAWIKCPRCNNIYKKHGGSLTSMYCVKCQSAILGNAMKEDPELWHKMREHPKNKKKNLTSKFYNSEKYPVLTEEELKIANENSSARWKIWMKCPQCGKTVSKIRKTGIKSLLCKPCQQRNRFK